MDGNDQLLGSRPDLRHDDRLRRRDHPRAADKADLDTLPRDSSPLGCETVTRHEVRVVSRTEEHAEQPATETDLRARSAARAFSALLAALAALIIVLTGCSGKTTGATNVTAHTAVLNAVGSPATRAARPTCAGESRQRPAGPTRPC